MIKKLFISMANFMGSTLEGLAFIVGNVSLILVFILLLTPSAIVYRLLKGDFLGLSFTTSNSYRIK